MQHILASAMQQSFELFHVMRILPRQDLFLSLNRSAREESES